MVSAGAPASESQAVMILVHDRNATPANILDLARRFDRPTFSYLAPAASNGASYPYSFMAEREKNEPVRSCSPSVSWTAS